MSKGSFALTAIAGLVSWPLIASAQAATPGAAAPKAPAAPTAPKAPPAKAAPAAKTPGRVAPKAAATPADKTAQTTEPAPEPAPPGTALPPPDQSAPPPATEAAPETAPLPAPAPTPPAPPPPSPPRPAPGIGLWPTQPSTSSAPATAPSPPASSEEVFAEDWWSHARPVFEIHGYFRTRAELFHNFSLGRIEDPAFATWPQPTDNSYTTTAGNPLGPRLCTQAETGGPSTQDNPNDPQHPLVGCRNKTQAGANIRFRLNPELHVSDNLRVLSQIDILDDVVLGSTPSSYAFRPSALGYQQAATSGYTANGVNSESLVPPTSGVNSLGDSIRVKRVWAEYTTPVGEVRFGRMPDHFGLGMVHHSGDGYDDDYQSTIDRIQFITAIKPLDLYLGGSWDFPNEGPISDPALPGGQPYDLAQLDDVNQWSLLLMRKQSPELVKNALAHDQFVLNGGAYVTYRKQLLASDQSGTAVGSQDATASTGANVPNVPQAALSQGYSRRNANIWTPDVWFQLLYKGFRFEAEAAGVFGSMDSDSTTPGYTPAARTIHEYGIATQLQQNLIEDKLRLNFDFGWASGDGNAYNSNSTNNLIPEVGQQPVNSHTISTFRFNPAYRIDLILNRNLLQRIQGVYYFKPSVEYDFMRKPSGQRLGGGAAGIWTRASEFVQTPGHANDLGIELDGRLYFQSKDGNLNDKPGKMGGFYAMLEYGVLFPLAGLGYMPVQKTRLGSAADTSAAQIVRMYLGVLF